MTNKTDMFSLRRCSTAAALGAMLLLAGCVQPGPTPDEIANAPAVPDDIVTLATESRLAQAIVQNCPAGFGYSDAHEEAVKSELARKYGQGETLPEWAGEASLQHTLQEFDTLRMPEYMKRRQAVEGKASTWCAAGKAEVAEGTAIGKYLIAR